MQAKCNVGEGLRKQTDVYFLLRFLANKGLTLVFVETKRGANDLAWFLQRNNYNVVPIHGDLKQFERERHLEMFRTGEANVLVATAVSIQEQFILYHLFLY